MPWSKKILKLRSTNICSSILKMSYVYGKVYSMWGTSFSFNGATAPSEPGPPHHLGFTMTLRHTTVGRTPIGEWSARRRDLCLKTQHSDRHPCLQGDLNPRSQEASSRCPTATTTRPLGSAAMFSSGNIVKDLHCIFTMTGILATYSLQILFLGTDNIEQYF